MIGEIWLPVVGWEASYEVSSNGRVRRRANGPGRYKTELILRPATNRESGYKTVTLKRLPRSETHYVHRLVARAFHGEPPQPHLDCCHNDNNKANNYWLNLRWDSRAGNEADKVKQGTSNRGERHGMAKLSDDDVKSIKRRKAAGEPAATLATAYGIAVRTVHDYAQGRRRAHVALQFKSE